MDAVTTKDNCFRSLLPKRLSHNAGTFFHFFLQIQNLFVGSHMPNERGIQLTKFFNQQLTN